MKPIATEPEIRSVQWFDREDNGPKASVGSCHRCAVELYDVDGYMPDPLICLNVEACSSRILANAVLALADVLRNKP